MLNPPTAGAANGAVLAGERCVKIGIFLLSPVFLKYGHDLGGSAAQAHVFSQRGEHQKQLMCLK